MSQNQKPQASPPPQSNPAPGNAAPPPLPQGGSPRQPDVFDGIKRCMHELARLGISKDQRNEQQRYQFRGIDQVYNHLTDALHKADLVIAPRYTERVVEQRETKNGTLMYNVSLTGTFVVASVRDGSSIQVVTFGEAQDTADKATNKAMSAAYKYMALQLFCIPTEPDPDTGERLHDDADRTTQPTSVAKRQPGKAKRPPGPEPEWDLPTVLGGIQEATTVDGMKKWARFVVYMNDDERRQTKEAFDRRWEEIKALERDKAKAEKQNQQAARRDPEGDQEAAARQEEQTGGKRPYHGI